MKLSDILKNNESSARQVLESQDYRAFLKNFFKIKKNVNPSYSYALFARQAKITKSLPRDITEGYKRITDKTLPGFIRAMELEGLLEEIFVHFVLMEIDGHKKKLVQRLVEQSHFTKTYTDSNFKDFRSPFLFAASGEVDIGVKLGTLSTRTGLTLTQIREALPMMEKLKRGRFSGEEDRFTPSTSQVHIVPERDKNFFIDFYLYCLNLQRQNVLSHSFHEIIYIAKISSQLVVNLLEI
jgi:uncharacterized protein (TIGR02147 family)